MIKPWANVRLGEVVREERTPVGTIDGDGLPVLGITNIEGVKQTGVEASDDKSKYLRLCPRRFVYNPYRINVGSIGLSSETQDGICSPAYVVFAPTEHIDPDFLLFFLKSARGNKLINFHGNRGTVRSALRFDDLCQIEVPLPPMVEQQRIVARIKDLATVIDEAQVLRQQAIVETSALLRSALHRLANKHKDQGKLKDILETLPRNGWSARCDNADDGIPVLSLGAVTGFRYRSTEFKRTSLYASKDGHFWLQPGDLLITRSNSPELVGHAAIYDGNPTPCIYPDLMMRLNLKPGRVEKRFVWYWLQSPIVREFISNNSKGTSPTMKKISQGTVAAIPFPSSLNIKDQQSIVVELDALQAEIDFLKRLQAETSAELNAMLPSIIDGALRGGI